MVAISLYKGNLHKVPNHPRRWHCPVPNISLKDFRTLLHRRHRALSRFHSSNPNPPPPDSTNAHTDPNPANNAIQTQESLDKGIFNEEHQSPLEGQDSIKKLEEATSALVADHKTDENVKTLKDKEDVSVDPSVVEKTSPEKDSSDVEKRKTEIKEELVVLNEKKHSLVQVLKQILKAEEQLKRQNYMQGLSSRPSLPLQVDTATDSASASRLNTPKMGSDGNPSGDMEGGEADDASNHNVHSLHLPHTSITSPSSDTQQRKPASNAVSHPHRVMVGVASSPSRFAPAGQGHSSVSVSGASYIASTPSPAASGGTSVFKDGKLSSPWN